MVAYLQLGQFPIMISSKENWSLKVKEKFYALVSRIRFQKELWWCSLKIFSCWKNSCDLTRNAWMSMWMSLFSKSYYLLHHQSSILLAYYLQIFILFSQEMLSMSKILWMNEESIISSATNFGWCTMHVMGDGCYWTHQSKVKSRTFIYPN